MDRNLKAYCPGYYIRDIIQSLQISWADFASAMDMSLDDVTKLIMGDIEIDEDIANKLEAFFKVSANQWLTLERQYQKTK